MSSRIFDAMKSMQPGWEPSVPKPASLKRLPKHLTDTTPRQRADWSKWFAQTLSLAELRARQVICQGQQKSGHEQLTRFGRPPGPDSRLDAGMADLRVLEDILMQAVDIQQFGEQPKKGAKRGGRTADGNARRKSPS